MFTKSSIASGLLILSVLPSFAAADVPYGIEAVTQYRSEYNYRGFQLADETTSFQLGLRYQFDDSTYLNSALWHDGEIGEGDFSEAGAILEIGKDLGDSSFTLSTTYRSYSHSIFENGVNIEATANYNLSENLTASGKVAYDTGANGLYGELGFQYYIRVNDDSYVNLSTGVSYIDDYYDLSGLNDAFAKASFTYNINDSVSFTPYVGTSLLLDNEENRMDSLYAGAYFAVSF